jgi:hypothetical protein
MAATNMIEMEAEAPTAPMREAPTQYYEALTGLVERLNPNTRQMRAQVYDRVRELLIMEAQQSDPPWDLLELVQEQRALEEAIKEIEADYEFEQQRRRPQLPNPEEWRELERSLPPGARRPQPREPQRPRQAGQRMPVPPQQQPASSSRFSVAAICSAFACRTGRCQTRASSFSRA